MTDTESNSQILPDLTHSTATPIPRETELSEAQPVSTPDSSSLPGLSKNAQRRLLKAEHFAATRSEWLARKKEKKRENKEKRRVERMAANDGEQPPAKKRKLGKTMAPRIVYKARVVVDLGFDELMSEKEVKSLCSQLAYCYNSNRHSSTPFESILCTTLNGKTLKRLQSLGNQHERWQDVQFWETGYEALWEETAEAAETVPRCAKENIVYLTGDSEEEIHELKEGETYIIGGICDHNRYKKLCLNKAREQSIRHARLPIGTYLKDFPTRKILTVNQVFDILLHWVEHREWEKALYAVMPKRKFCQGGKKTVAHEGTEDTGEKMGESDDVEQIEEPEAYIFKI